MNVFGAWLKWRKAFAAGNGAVQKTKMDTDNSGLMEKQLGLRELRFFFGMEYGRTKLAILATIHHAVIPVIYSAGPEATT